MCPLINDRERIERLPAQLHVTASSGDGDGRSTQMRDRHQLDGLFGIRYTQASEVRETIPWRINGCTFGSDSEVMFG